MMQPVLFIIFFKIEDLSALYGSQTEAFSSWKSTLGQFNYESVYAEHVYIDSIVLEGEGGEEVEESKWQDRIAFRFDQIISFASTAMEDKRRRSDEACNTSPDSGIGHGEVRPTPNEANPQPAPPPAAVPQVKSDPAITEVKIIIHCHTLS